LIVAHQAGNAITTHVEASGLKFFPKTSMPSEPASPVLACLELLEDLVDQD